MRQKKFGRLFDGSREGLLLALIAAIPIGVVVTSLGTTSGAADAVAITSGMIAGVFLLLAACCFYVQWRTAPDPRQGWVVAAAVLIAGQVLMNAAFELDPRRHGFAERGGWPLVVEAMVVVTAIVWCRAGLRTRAARMYDPLMLGLAFVLIAAGLRILLEPWGAVALPSTAASLLTFATLGAHLAVSALVLRNPRLARWARWRFAATVGLLGVGHAAILGPAGGSAVDIVSASTIFAAGIIWASATFVLLRESLDMQRHRASSLEGSLLEIEHTARGTRERLHEVKSTVAGLSSAADLLSDASLPADVRERLERSIRTELARLERLVAKQPRESGTVAVDDVVDSVLELHRAQGRTIAWEHSGARVVGTTDAVAEAINILLENAAAHGGDNGSRVAVESEPGEDVVLIRVSDTGPGIPAELRESVFDWGVGRPDTPGQGIGLNLAQRLMTEHGGSLTLDEPAMGSAFTIRLPAARQSEENDDDAAAR